MSMKRRSFLQSIAAAVLSVYLARQLGAEVSEVDAPTKPDAIPYVLFNRDGELVQCFGDSFEEAWDNCAQPSDLPEVMPGRVPINFIRESIVLSAEGEIAYSNVWYEEMRK